MPVFVMAAPVGEFFSSTAIEKDGESEAYTGATLFSSITNGPGSPKNCRYNEVMEGK